MSTQPGPAASGVVVVGSHTDIGKTWVSCRLLESWRRQGIDVAAKKPIVSGFDECCVAQSDPGLLLAALGRDGASVADVNEISPWRFPDPVAPDEAARRAGREVTLREVLAFCRAPSPRLQLIETAGGVMSPFTSDGTTLDFVLGLGLPTVLVVGDYLGGISHGLSAWTILRDRNIPVLGIVINRATDANAERAYRQHTVGTAVWSVPVDGSLEGIATVARDALRWSANHAGHMSAS